MRIQEIENLTLGDLQPVTSENFEVGGGGGIGEKEFFSSYFHLNKGVEITYAMLE